MANSGSLRSTTESLPIVDVANATVSKALLLSILTVCDPKSANTTGKWFIIGGVACNCCKRLPQTVLGWLSMTVLEVHLSNTHRYNRSLQ